MTDYRQTVRETVFNACVLDGEYKGRTDNFVETDVFEALQRCNYARVENYGITELLEILAEASKENKALSDAFTTVKDFIETVDSEEKAINKMFIEDEARTIRLAKEKAYKVAKEYWQTLSDSAKWSLEVKESIYTYEQLAELVLPDYQYNEDEITMDLFRDVVEYELLYDTEDKESLYL